MTEQIKKMVELTDFEQAYYGQSDWLIAMRHVRKGKLLVIDDPNESDQELERKDVRRGPSD